MTQNKSSSSIPAILGGTPAFSSPLYVGTPNIGDKERILGRIADALDNRRLTNFGPLVREFEARIAEYCGVKHCITVCNATIGLELLIRAMGLKGEVIVPAMTFVATAHALQWQEITPVFCDIDPHTCTIDPQAAERMITPRTSGIIGVHLWGRACDIDALQDVADRHHLALGFDAAHSFGVTYKGRRIGGFGRAEVFSFHATKFLNSFEGGAIVTNDDALAAQLRLMENFGFSGFDQVIYLGTNGKMTEASAAMGLSSFESIDELITANRRNYRTYCEELADVPGIDMQEYPEDEETNYQYVILRIKPEICGVSRDALYFALQQENVIVRRYFYPGVHRMEPYRSYQPHAHLMLPHTERIVHEVLAMPTGTAVTEDDVRKICQTIRQLLSHASEVEAVVTQGTQG